MGAVIGRLLAGLLGLTVLAACVGITDGQDGPAVVGEDPADPEPGSPDGGPDGSAQEPGSADPPAPGEPGEPDSAQPPGEDPVPPAPPAGQDLDPVGQLCRTYLRPQVGRLVIEIASQSGAAPAPAAVAHLEATLRDVVDKDDVVVEAHEIPGDSRTWSTEDLRAFAQEHRRHYSNDQQVVLFVLSVRGRFADGDSLGVAHRASELAIFPDRIGGLSALLGGRAAVERAVLVHEAGHLLCLVNVTYASDLDHEDPEHPHHSNDRTSVMYWAIETSAIAQLFTGPPPDTFTENDRADLDGLRAGRY